MACAFFYFNISWKAKKCFTCHNIVSARNWPTLLVLICYHQHVIQALRLSYWPAPKVTHHSVDRGFFKQGKFNVASLFKTCMAIWQANTVNESHKAGGREKWNVRPVKGRMLNCWERPILPGRAWRPFGLRSKQCHGGNKGLQVPPASAAYEGQFWRASSVGKTRWHALALVFQC